MYVYKNAKKIVKRGIEVLPSLGHAKKTLER